jgi:ADP-ribosylation factor GTPase-activating protein 1
MDAWNPDQLKRMQKGGNSKLNAFLLEYGVEKHMDIKEKYNSKAAEFYREKLRAEVDGHSYTPPPPSDVVQLSAMSRSKSYGGGIKSSKSAWDEWDSPNSGSAFGNQEQLRENKSNGNGYSQQSGPSLQALHASAAKKEDFFSRKVAENAAKPEGLPPSQGGKYVGFGSTPVVPPRNQGTKAGVDDVSEMFSRGFSGLGVWAGQAANAARDQATNISTALKDSGVTDKIGQSAQVAAERTREYGSKGWSLLRSAYMSAASRIEQSAAQQGYKIDLGSRKVSGSSYSRVEGSKAPEGFNESFGNAETFDNDNLINHHRGDNGFDDDDWGRENEWHQDTQRAPEASLKDVGRIQQQDEWSGWEDAHTHEGSGDAAHDGANDWGKW